MKTVCVLMLLFATPGLAGPDWGDGDPSETLIARTAGLSPDGKTALVAYEGWLHFRRRPLRFLKLWDLETQTVIWSFFEETARCVFISFLPQTRTVILATEDGEVRKLDLASGQPIGTIKAFKVSFTRSFHHFAVSGDGKWLVGAGSDDRKSTQFKLIDLEKGRAIREFPFEKSPDHLEISPDKTLALFTSWGGHHETWLMSLDFGKIVTSFDGKEGWKATAAFCPDGTLALWKAGPEEKREILFWDLTKQAVVRSFPIGDAVAWSLLPAGPSLRTIHKQDQKGGASVRIWDLATGKQLKSWHWPDEAQHFAAITADGSRALGLSGWWTKGERVVSDMRLQLRDMGTGKVLASWLDPTTADERPPDPPEPPLFVEEENVWSALAARWPLLLALIVLSLVALRMRNRAAPAARSN